MEKQKNDLRRRIGPLRYGWWVFWLSAASALQRRGDVYSGWRCRLFCWLISVARLAC